MMNKKSRPFLIKSKGVLFYRTTLLLVCFLFTSFALFSQKTPSVKAEIDTTSIKIGQQINYKITVEADSLDIVNFPEDQTFSPLEMVEALTIDTTISNNRLILQRIYALTQFDSGAYTIPQQRIAINEQAFLTDSFRIKVADVAVDTTKQKMYDIKPLLEVEKSRAKLWWTILCVLIGVLAIGALAYWYINREKPLTEDEKIALLPPYDRALIQLKELENSKYLIQDEHKKYYSELTKIVRSYLEEEVHVSALESTTDQLILRLELLKDAGELDLQDETLQHFKKVLQTADLVKFAKSKPANAIAEQDRKLVEDIVVKTKEALPEPTEEDLLENEAYLEELAEKKKRKRIYIAAAALGFLIAFGTVFSITYFGFKKVKDTIFGYPTKELLENEWVKSSYGFPSIEIETPEVLVRKEIELPEEAKELIKKNQTFTYGSYLGLFSMTASSTTYKDAEAEPQFEAALAGMLGTMEAAGLKNIITKQDEFTTNSGVEGLKVYGSGQMQLPDSNINRKMEYAILLFGGKGFIQQVVLTWESGDEYAEKIVERILASVDVKAVV
ncbi:hypothetical protein GCM10011414_04090 [Croceivirga lutea]|uniref:BatD family protein n=1 Tax=Croceivirga lutea TaxID=1775167 RepID=UPI0019880D6D|nr:BatD family protein [Croceivirga lutea]GGG37942.1 hypothetical protein GCM10011414_04090 [Croceivirga lutea]